MLVEKSRVQKNLEIVDVHVGRTILAIRQAIRSLNDSYSALWNLPDEELEEALQYLYDQGILRITFEKHYETATVLNELATAAGVELRAADKAAREFSIDAHGGVHVAPRPDTERVETPIVEDAGEADVHYDG